MMEHSSRDGSPTGHVGWLPSKRSEDNAHALGDVAEAGMTATAGVVGARFRLASLWLAQTARVLADNCLRMVVVLQVAGAGSRASEAAWHKTNVFFILPFLLLAPVN